VIIAKVIRSLVFFFLINSYCYAQSGRLENEFKLAIPNNEVNELWNFITEEFAVPKLDIGDQQLNGEQSVEIFKDTYFDNSALELMNLEIGLRFRKRYKDDVLLKELIQLKTPYSADKIVRNELKYNVSKEQKKSKLKNRHPLFKLLNLSDIKKLKEDLASFKINTSELKKSVQLNQKRSRVYISDTSGQSVATITLDEVSNASFPYQKYAELELELNEIRYTNASIEEQKKMEACNTLIQNKLMNKFKNLTIDQRPKYNKMMELIEKDFLSSIQKNWVWAIFAFIVLLAIMHYLKYNLFESH